MASTATSGAQLWTMIHDERQKVGEMLGTLSDAEWDTPSLCAGWRVRDVAAHLTETQLMTPGKFFGRFIGSGFNFDNFSGKAVASHSSQSTSELLAQYRETMGRTTAPPGPKVVALGEVVIHGEDIARPTGRKLSYSPPALVAVADYTRATTPLLHGKQRSAGLRLRATDVDWTVGDGPEVSGPAAALISAMAGRPAALADLSGDGVETLRARM